ncbi:hypothetical protein [Clostridium psychrophilum]|uniref:hypothetical protein n=1 Tax=Clostridium psychrophilum TaxID=132926 RepID=UPI001C0E309D|nr:hypothetical protein [Clostridium psychrophilum]MBU3181236.1 hypothetical protein [Clostridium psychrophilum]
MNSNIEFLNYIYQNSEMGKSTISELMNIVKDEPFKKNLESQLKEYTEIFSASSDLIKQSKETSKGIGAVTKLTSYIIINIKTLTNKTPSHISQMLIQGSTMGIIDVTKHLKEYKDANKNIKDLADRLLKFEQQNVEEMKKFL